MTVALTCASFESGFQINTDGIRTTRADVVQAMWNAVSARGFRRESSKVCKVSDLRTFGIAEVKTQDRSVRFSQAMLDQGNRPPVCLALRDAEGREA